jgi:hypothetical protein
MFIVNGRVGNDKNIGRFTIKCVVVREHLKTIYYFLEYQSQKIILEVQVHTFEQKLSRW